MTTAVGPVPQTVQHLGISHLLPHPANRKHFDKTKLAELADSIGKVGIHTPLIVRHLADTDPTSEAGWYQIIAGERRWRAAQQVKRPDGIGLATIPCIVRELTDDEAIELLLTENLQREDPSPLEEADTYQAWLDRPGHDVKELAARIGKSVAHIYSRLQLRHLTESARKEVDQGTLPIGHAQLLARLAPAQQDAAVNKLVAEEWRGTPKLSQFMRQVTGILPNIDSARFDPKDAELCPSAGACTTCPKRLGFKEGVFPELAAALAEENADQDGNECLDPSCYDEKTAAYLEIQIAAARKKHGEALVLVSWKYGEKWPAKATAPLPRGLWKRVAKTVAGAVPAIVVKEDAMSGESGAGLGDLIWVTVKAKPKAAPAGTSAAAPVAKSTHEEDQAKREARAKVEYPRRGALAKVLLTRVPKALDTTWLIEIVFEQYVGDYSVRRAAKALGITAPSRKSRKPADVMLALALNEISDELELHHAQWYEMEQIPALAKRFGIDAKKVLADYDALVKAGQKKLAEPKPKARAGDVARAKKAKKRGAK